MSTSEEGHRRRTPSVETKLHRIPSSHTFLSRGTEEVTRRISPESMLLKMQKSNERWADVNRWERVSDDEQCSTQCSTNQKRMSEREPTYFWEYSAVNRDERQAAAWPSMYYHALDYHQLKRSASDSSMGHTPGDEQCTMPVTPKDRPITPVEAEQSKQVRDVSLQQLRQWHTGTALQEHHGVYAHHLVKRTQSLEPVPPLTDMLQQRPPQLVTLERGAILEGQEAGPLQRQKMYEGRRRITEYVPTGAPTMLHHVHCHHQPHQGLESRPDWKPALGTMTRRHTMHHQHLGQKLPVVGHVPLGSPIIRHQMLHHPHAYQPQPVQQAARSPLLQPRFIHCGPASRGTTPETQRGSQQRFPSVAPSESVLGQNTTEATGLRKPELLLLQPPSLVWYINQPRGGTPISWSSKTSLKDYVRPLEMTPKDVAEIRRFRRCRFVLLQWIVLWVFIVTVSILLFAILLVRHSRLPRLDKDTERRLGLFVMLSNPNMSVNDSIDRSIVTLADESRIRQYLREVTSGTHTAGVNRDEPLSKYVEKVWQENGLNTTAADLYSVMLAVGDADHLSTIYATSATMPSVNTWSPSFAAPEKAIPGVAEKFGPVFNAYSRTGVAEGQVYYCNRCLREDFEGLVKMNLSPVHKICLCRYTADVSPGTAAMHAEEYHVKGIMFFMDPEDVAPDDGKPQFPHSWWMPLTAVRRSNLRSPGDIGDPSTRGYSSRSWSSGLYRAKGNNLRLPRVYSQPIMARTAQGYMSMLQGKPCPDSWAPHLAYNCYIGDMSDITVHMDIKNILRQMPIENVMAYIEGAVEPDRYVILGVPLDSFSTGAASPGTAITQALEVTRIFGRLIQDKQWRPRRTILFTGWDAHELGHIGATEYVEGNRHVLMSRAVLYINCDICTSGGEFMVSGSPSISASFTEAAKVVPHFSDPHKAYYDVWQKDPKTKVTAHGVPVLPILRSEGGHLPVVQISGVPSLDVGFGNNHSHSLYYPALGTGYDTFHLVDNFIDPNFKLHRMCAQLIGVVLRRWADALILPYDFHRLRSEISAAFDELCSKHSATINRWHFDMDPISSGITRLGMNLDVIAKYIKSYKDTNPLATRRLNDMIMYVERIFVQGNLQGLDPGKYGSVRNVVFGWASTNTRQMTFFPVLDELLTEQGVNKDGFGHNISLHISYVASSLLQAAAYVDVGRVI
ncbi:N-acetylated-alpha-linked acidic dipeptidase 2-like isoform X2 [Ornithodoros turicata]